MIGFFWFLDSFFLYLFFIGVLFASNLWMCSFSDDVFLFSRRTSVSHPRTRREFLRDLGISAAAFPFFMNLPSLGFANQQGRKKRLVVMFSPNGIVPKTFWPDEAGKLDAVTLKESLTPLEPFRDKTLDLARRLRQGPRRRR